MHDLGSVHSPVMLQEVLAAFAPAAIESFVDATVGAGGHSVAILERWPGCRLLGIDRDPEAIELARVRLANYSDRVELRQGNFRNLGHWTRECGFTGADGILMDLGVSSMHLDNVKRGFSYAAPEAPLDMRMDPAQPTTAAGLLSRLDEGELSRILRDWGEERWASRIAAFIVRQRARKPIETAGDLIEVIKAAIPAAARRTGGHPARRTFQALRIAVNDELSALAEGLEQGAAELRPGGRFIVISFHSLEDRLVKQAFRRHGATLGYNEVTRKPLTPTGAEIESNPRARSAKLRVLARNDGQREEPAGVGNAVTGSTGGRNKC